MVIRQQRISYHPDAEGLAAPKAPGKIGHGVPAPRTHGQMTRAMILAAGFGTRLAPLTDELPKPLVPVGEGPMLARIAETLALAGLSSFVLNVHHLADEFASL